ncbi:MAG: type II CAAX endopeptidase family protein [Candidatus Saelkia tenebricola]|nr:type II CAAX endopeptidase family protein [Candidatus Saelkia tenebricola]
MNFANNTKKFVEEFGFYIFILFSTFLISIFESIFPKHESLEGLYARALVLEKTIEEKLSTLSKGGDIYSGNIYIALASFILFFIITGSLILFLFRFFKILKSKKPLIKSSNFSPYPLWGLKDFFKIVIWILFWAQVLGLSDEFFRRFYRMYTEREYIVIALLSSLFLDIIIIAMLVYWLKKHCRQNLQAVGIHKENLFKKFNFAAFNYFSFLPIIFIAVFISAVYLQKYQAVSSPQTIIYFLLFEKNPWIVMLTVLFIVVIGPFMEELLFRGLLYNSLKKSIGYMQAMIAASLLFSLLHMNVIGFLPILILALLFTYLYEKTGSLMVSVFVHMLHNGFLIFIIFILRVYLRI